MNKIIERKTLISRDRDLGGFQKFLYRNFIGRLILKLLIRPWVSKLGGFYMNRKCSKGMIKKFVKKNNIDLSQYDMTNIKCYNDFFTRKIIDGARNINMESDKLISPCDSKLQAFKINEESIFNIKDSYYKIEDLIQNKELAKEYINGYCLIFRLTVDDYHRYCYVDNGTKTKNTPIKGVLHTVNPIALERYNFYKTNSREYCILETENFGKIIQVEVGALMVGKISNHHQEYAFSKGEEKGMFLFGGSTIVLLVKENIKIDEDILFNTSNNDETVVRYGEAIGTKI